ncbi:hypothetical protein CC80DRAFT_525288 [Byssothecium circinans]|uniref:Protein kinase domain-containing protein n=1 Tax=Byssothecium circinans TaxID=147558 RepID=A0A6A5TX21_9PLEO|nr:hypothetical protein CC80DRAFT_525288 [Byssothecium circinans]
MGDVLAALGLIDPAIKAGKRLIQACEDFRHANDEIRERIKKIQSVWIVTERQIAFLGRIWKTLDEGLQEHQSELLDELTSKLDAANKQIGRVTHRKETGDEAAKVIRWKYVAIKGSIDKAIEQLREWQREFDPGWFLMMKIADAVIDRELAEEVNPCDVKKGDVDSMSTARNVRKFLKADPQEKFTLWRNPIPAHQNSIPYSAARTVWQSDTRHFIVDTVSCPPGGNLDILYKDVRDLARKLSVADPETFGLLQCAGVVRRKAAGYEKPNVFDFLFLFPKGLQNPRSLRSVLLSKDPNTSLSRRYHVARQLAQSVSYVHTYGFVHKSIRPDTILVMEDGNTPLAASFLLGFEKFRTADGRTLRAGDSVWEKDLYRHPRRQGLKPEEEYRMQHDIYSLGVCMLEIGLWDSFVLFEAGKAIASKVLPGYVDEDEKEYQKAVSLKQSLVEHAKKKLPSRMGDKYTEVVVNCLTCLDEDNVDFGDPSELEDEDGVQIGVRFIEKILRKLNSISI